MGNALLRTRQTQICLVRKPRHGSMDPTGSFELRHTDRHRLSALPQLEQRGGQRWKRAGLAEHFGDELVDRSCLEADTLPQRGLLDRAATLLHHWADKDLVSPHEGCQPGVFGASADEVRPDGQHYDRAARGSSAALTSASTNAARSASSVHSVKASSNWSTTTTTAPCSFVASRTASSGSTSSSSPGRADRASERESARSSDRSGSHPAAGQSSWRSPAGWLIAARRPDLHGPPTTCHFRTGQQRP